MSLSQKTNMYDCLCAAVRKPLSEGGYVALTAALQNQPADYIADAVAMMTNDEALAVFNWLDNARAGQVLRFLRPDQVDHVLRHAPAGRLSQLAV